MPRVTRSSSALSDPTVPVATARRKAETKKVSAPQKLKISIPLLSFTKSKLPKPATTAKASRPPILVTIAEDAGNKVPPTVEEIIEPQGTSTGADKSKSKRPLKEPGPHSSTSVPSGSEVGDVEDIGKKPKWVPDDWKKALRYIRIMREERKAPVDTMGCERTMEENVEPKVRRYQALISLMLSSQTKDQVTFAAMGRLKDHGLTVQKILDMDEGTLGQLIIPVGFWKKKADYIKRTTEILRAKYDDDIPDNIEDLCSLPGVGPKMGYIALSVAWGQNAGIGVDTHVHRIANRLHWAGPKGTKTPEQTRVILESWLPVELWPEVNILLVGFGQEQCLPVNPKCSTCIANELCPFGIKELNLGFLLSKKGHRTVD